MSDLLYALGFYVDYADGGRAIISVLCLLFIAYGTLSCFYGYKIFKFITGVCGFIIGTVLGFVLAIGTGGPDISGPVLIISSILVGVIGAFLAVKLYYVGVFLIGALFGGLLGFVLTASSDGGAQAPVILLLAIAAGILSVIIRKFMIILSTSVSGAQTMSTALYILIYAISGNDYDVINNFLWIVLAVIGFWYQYSSNKNAPADPIAQVNGGVSAPGIPGKSFQALARYRKPLIIACIIILAFMLFGPRMPFGLLLLIIAAAIGIYLVIDRNSAKSSANNGTATAFGSAAAGSAAAGNSTVAASGTGAPMGGGAVTATESSKETGGVATSAESSKETGSAATAAESSQLTGSINGDTENKIECASCHALNNAGSKFCGHCGTPMGNGVSGDTPVQGSF